MEDGKTLTEQMTSGDKSVRGKLCYPFTQPIWWVVLPVRFLVSWIGGMISGLIFGKEAGQKVRVFLWREILTPANFLTSVRFWLLGKAIMLFFAGAAASEQSALLFFAIITDFFDGPLARNNNEVTALGTYMDHIGDWSVVVWVMLLNFYYAAMPNPYLYFYYGLLAVSFASIAVLLIIYSAKFRKFYDADTKLIANINAFATEELQTDFWGRIQFTFLVIAIFGFIFAASSAEPDFALIGALNPIPEKLQWFIIGAALALYLTFGGYSTRDAMGYSEAQAKKFKEKLRKIKNGSPR